MCYGSVCKFELYNGECGKPLNKMPCPVDLEDDKEDIELDFDDDDYSYDDRAEAMQWGGIETKDSPI